MVQLWIMSSSVTTAPLKVRRAPLAQKYIYWDTKLSLPLIFSPLSSGMWGFGAYPRCHWVGGRVHPGQASNPSQGQTKTDVTTQSRQPREHPNRLDPESLHHTFICSDQLQSFKTALLYNFLLFFFTVECFGFATVLFLTETPINPSFVCSCA